MLCPDSTTCYQSEYVGDEGSPSLLAMIALDSMPQRGVH